MSRGGVADGARAAQCSLPVTLCTFPALCEQDRLSAYRINGYWRGVDNAKDLKEATKEVAAFGWVRTLDTV